MTSRVYALPIYLAAPAAPQRTAAYTVEERIALAAAAVHIKAGVKLGHELSSTVAHAMAPLAAAAVPLADVIDLVDALTDRKLSASYIGRLYREASHV